MNLYPYKLRITTLSPGSVRWECHKLRSFSEPRKKAAGRRVMGSTVLQAPGWSCSTKFVSPGRSTQRIPLPLSKGGSRAAGLTEF